MRPSFGARGKIILKELTFSSRRSDSRVRREVREREKMRRKRSRGGNPGGFPRSHLAVFFFWSHLLGPSPWS